MIEHIESLEHSPEDTDIEVQVPDHELPEYIGHRRENILFIKDKFKLRSLSMISGTKNSIKVI